MFAVYVYVGKFTMNLRSNTDNMFLVLLCFEHDPKCFRIAKVFSELFVDLKSLETK